MSRVQALIRFGSDFGPLAAWDLLIQKFSNRTVYSVRVSGIRTPVRFRKNTIDLTVMHQIFTQRECIVPLTRSPRAIIDGGANVGYSSLLFANTYPDADIVAVEPEGSNCRLFRENCAAYSNIRLVEGAIWPERRTLTIENENTFHDAFRVTDAVRSGSRQVEGYTIADLIEMTGRDRVDILKLDIEGSEKDVFEGGVSSWIDRVDVVMIELHDRFRPGCTDAAAAAVGARSRRREIRGEYTVFHLRN